MFLRSVILLYVHSCTYNYYSRNKAFVKRIVLSLAQKTTKCMRPMRTAVFHSHIQTENFPFGLNISKARYYPKGIQKSAAAVRFAAETQRDTKNIENNGLLFHLLAEKNGGGLYKLGFDVAR